MSVEEMRGAWRSLARSTREFYERPGSSSGEPVREYLRAGRSLESDEFQALTDTLDAMIEASERLRTEADTVLRKTASGEDKRTAEGEYEQIAELMLAAAAVDALLARDILALDPEAEYDRYEEPREEGLSPADVFDEGQQLLGRVGGLFGDLPESLAGRSPYDAQLLIDEVAQATVDLVAMAEPPAHDLVRGLTKAAGGAIPDILSAVQHLEVVSTLELRAHVLAKHAPRFVREHVMKIVTLRLDGSVVDEMADKLAEWFANSINAEGLLNRIADPQKAVALANATIHAAPIVEHEDAEALLADLATLNNNYRKHMGWIGDSAKWLRRGASPLSHLGAALIGPLSYAAAGGIFFVGIGYVGYSLTDRLDARRLGFADRVEGVVRLVERHI